MTTPEQAPSNHNQICGIVMPISAIDGCSEAHWSEVLNIITESIESAGFEANLVSNADDVGIIQKRIIQNLYSNPIVVCDVSGKNPNVMLELGMRLAFDKPVVIIKDDKTTYSFDTSPIEHITYPRDLRFSKIIEFKSTLKNKIEKTIDSAKKDSGFSPFLKHFGEFKVAKIDTTEVSSDLYVLEEIKSIKLLLSQLENKNRNLHYRSHDGRARFSVTIKSDTDINEEAVIDIINKISGAQLMGIYKTLNNIIHADIDADPFVTHQDIRMPLQTELSNAEIKVGRIL